MILEIAGTIMKLMLVVVLIGVMILALMGINCLVVTRSQHVRDDREKRLRDSLEHSDRVIPPGSVFHDFLPRDLRRRSRHHKTHTTA